MNGGAVGDDRRPHFADLAKAVSSAGSKANARTSWMTIGQRRAGWDDGASLASMDDGIRCRRDERIRLVHFGRPLRTPQGAS